MLCSPLNLQRDMNIWWNSDVFTRSYQNLTEGQPYDCVLTSVPCESNITKTLLVSSDAESAFLIDVIVIYIGLSLVVVMGIVGNVINIVVFSTNNIANDSTNTLFLCLSVSDLLYILAAGVLVSSSFLCFFDESLALSAMNITFPPVYNSTRWFSLLSLDFVTVISIQRAVAIVLPFKISTIFSNRNTKIIIVGLVALCVCTLLPMCLAYYPRWIFHPYFNKIVSLGYIHILPHNFAFTYPNAYFNTHGAIDLVIIITSGALTVFKLRDQGKTRTALTAGKTSSSEATAEAPKMSAREAKVIKMSATVCFITFFIYSVVMVGGGLISTYSKNLFESDVPLATTNCATLLGSVGCTFNFFLYLTMSAQYREIFTNMFRIGPSKQISK